MKRILSGAVFAVAALFAAVSASASTLNIIGGTTEIQVTADLAGLGLTPSTFFGGGTLDTSTGILSYDITGGTITGSDAVIEHAGSSLVLTGGGVSAFVGNFVIDTAAATVFGNVLGGSDSVALLDFGTIDSSGIQLLISADLAGALTTVFGAPNLTGAELGIANTAPVVPLPAAGWMLLAGVGGLVVMRRRAQAAAA